MEALYSALEGEISTFVRHVQQCQKGFDLRSLYHMLLLVLPRSPSGQVESWQHLQRLAHCQTGSASPDMASSYVDWLASDLQHLSTLKERFNTRVVVPLCENLYMHEEPAVCPTQWSPLASIPHLAAQLFTHRSNWGLLLQGGTLSESVFSPQSLHDVCGFADVGPFVKVFRLVPDVFHQSLVTAHLAQRWVCLHRSRYSLSLPPSPSLPQQPPAWGRAGLAPSTVQPPLCSRDAQQPGSPLGLYNLMVPGMGVGRRQHQAALAEELQKSLELEEYHHSILEADWLLELEVRPILLRHVFTLLALPSLHNRVQQCCQDLERALRGQALPAQQHAQLTNRMATTPALGQTQPSATSPMALAQPLEQSVTDHRRWDYRLLPAAAPRRA